MGKKLLYLATVLSFGTSLQNVSAQDTENLALSASSVTANYTTTWNRISALNDGEYAYSGSDHTKAWGCWKGTTNDPIDTLTYLWDEPLEMSASTIYFWTDKEQSTGGTAGVTIPDSWKLQYHNADDDTWNDVTLVSGTSYTVLKGEPNYAIFEEVTADGLRAIINAFLNADGYYEAVCVSEWEVRKQTEQELYYSLFAAAYNKLDELLEGDAAEYYGICEEISELQMEVGDYNAETDIETLKAATTACTEIYENAESAISAAATISLHLNKIETKLLPKAYPGADALRAVYAEISDFIASGEGYSADYMKNDTILSEAIETYYYSQTYSEDSPADYTFLINSPLMVKESAEPTIEEDGTFTYPNIDNYSDGTTPSDDIDSEGWMRANTTGDQRYNFKQGRVCWNAWASGFDELSFFQDLSSLPNGYYTISADLTTGEGMESTQHVFGTSATQTVTSPNLTGSTWVSEAPYNGTWVTLTTDKVMVTDGNLTVGAASTGSSTTGAMGWFLVTNFKLYYYGPVDEDDLKATYEAKIAECQAQCDTMMFAVDKATFQAAIDKYKNVELSQMNAAIDSLHSAQTISTASITEWTGLTTGTYAALQDSVAAGIYGEQGNLIVNKAVEIVTNWMNSASATYTDSPSKTTILRYYRDSYLPVFKTAAKTAYTSSSAQAVIAANIADQVEELTDITELPTTDTLDFYIAELQNAISVANAADLFANGSTDYTSIITNPDFDDIVDGWTIYSPNTVTGTYDSSQNYDGQSGYYLNAWTASTGALVYNAHQTLSNIPNGTYKLQAIVRTNGTAGTYLYTIADNDSVEGVKMTEVVMQPFNYTKYVDPTVKAADGGDSIIYSAGMYGEIWAEAYDMFYSGEVTGAELERYGEIIDANSSRGHGWFRANVEAEVKNHELIIGFANDYDFTEAYGGNKFDGTWLSADNFTLTLVSLGDNSDWDPTTDMNEVDSSAAPIYRVVNGAIYTEGVVVSTTGSTVASGEKLPTGVYIIKEGTNIVKVSVK